ncbi:MAG: STAS domain-containing protein [Pirellulales bacterium]
MDLQITRSESGDTIVLACSGRLDAETGDELASAVADELRRGHLTIRLDLDDTGFLSSAGIRGLFDTYRAAKAAGGSCLIRRASATVRRVLDLTRLTPILVEPMGEGAPPAPRPTATEPGDVTHGQVTLVRCVRAAAHPLPATLCGSPDAVLGGDIRAGTLRVLSPHAFAFGLGSLADGDAPAARAGELAAACGTVFHRPPRPHAAVDYVVPTADLRADAELLAALSWEGVPSGQAGFETASDEPAIRLDDLVEAVMAETTGETVAIVVAGEIHGLVAAELIRPLTEAGGGDTPRAGTRDTAATWLSFSREPVFARHTALIVGVATRAAGGPLGDFVRRVPGRSFSSHFHAVVFPFRPVRRGGADLAATVADLAASRPLAVLHLIADPRPVLGSGVSELVRGGVWFAPLAGVVPEGRT